MKQCMALPVNEEEAEQGSSCLSVEDSWKTCGRLLCPEPCIIVSRHGRPVVGSLILHLLCSLILSVTGGALAFDVQPKLVNMIKTGLQVVLNDTNPCIISGGTHVGVMKLIGEIMAEVSQDRFIPVIGIRASCACA